MREYLAQSILHAFVAAGVIETLLRLWRLADPAERLAFRLLALTLPVVVAPVFWTCAPFRGSAAFADTLALFASRHWAAVRVGWIDVGTATLLVAAGVGVFLYARDLAPMVRGFRRRDHQSTGVVAEDPLVGMVTELARRVGLSRPPRIRVLEDETPVLLASGVVQPSLCVSRGTLGRLNEHELRATLTHELVHLGRGDVLLGWGVMVVRTLMLANPVAQILARGVVLELERRADDTAARVLGEPHALADGMERLVGERLRTGPRTETAREGSIDELVMGLALKGRAAALARRCSRLRACWPPVRRELPALRVALTSVALAGLLFFVV